MAFEMPVLVLSLEVATTALVAADRGKFFKLDTAGKIVVCAGATDKPIGVLLSGACPIGGTAEVGVLGVFKVQSDAALAIGDIIGTSADGQADAKTPGTDTTEYSVGRVLEASAAAGGFVTAMINTLAPQRAA